MNLEAKKISFIQEFLKIDNENIINALENLLYESKTEAFENNLKPLTKEQLNNQIDQSLEDEKEDRIINALELKQKIQEWN